MNARLADKVRGLLDEARNTLEHALLGLEVMRPLVSDQDIIGPLDKTFAANTLNALTWTLYSQAALDAFKALLDKNDNSASVMAAMKLLNRPEVLKELRDRRTAPIKVNVQHDSSLPPELQRELEEQFMREEQQRAANEFDTGLANARKLFAELVGDPVVKRLAKSRNKVMAHTDTVLEAGKYRRREPRDFGLQWGDAEHVTKAGCEIVAGLFSALFGHGIALSDARRIFADYSGDFWNHLRTGLKVNGGGPDKPVRERPRV